MSISASQFLEFCAIFGVPTGGVPTPGPWVPLAGGTMTGDLILSSGANLDVTDAVTLRSQFLQVTAIVSSTPIARNETNTVWVMPTATWDLFDPAGLASTDYQPGFNLTVKNTSVGDVTFTPFGTETIDGVAGAYTIAAGTAVTFMAYGLPNPTAWLVTANYSLGGGGLVWPSYSRQVPVDGFSITIPNNIQNLILIPGSPLATGTVVMPASPVDRQVANVSCEAAGIAALTVNGNAGQTIGNAPTSLAAGQGFAYQYDLSTTNWMPLYQPSASAGGVTALQVQQLAFNNSVDSGAANAYVGTYSPAMSVAPPDGTIVTVSGLLNTNTGNSTFDAGFGAVSIANNEIVLLTGGEMLAGGDYNLQYNQSNTAWVLLNSSLAPAAGVTAAQIQDQSFTYAVDSGVANAVVLALAPTIVSNATVWATFQCAANNTGATTIDCGFGVVSLVTNGGALVGGELLAGGTYSACFNTANNNYVLFNSSLSSGGGVTAPQVQDDAFNTGVDTGVSNAYVIALSPPVSGTYPNGLLVKFVPTHACTGTSTLDAGAGAKLIQSNTFNAPLISGDMSVNNPAYLMFSLQQNAWILFNPLTSIVTPYNIQYSNFTYSVDSGGAPNVYVGSYAPLVIAPGDDLVLSVKVANANTGASTFDAGFGAVAINNLQDAALVGGEMLLDGIYDFKYNTTSSTWVLQNSSLSSGGGVTPAQLQNQTFVSAVDSGSANNYAIALSPPLTSYSNFASFWFTTPNANTGNCTINVNGVGVIALTDTLGHNLAPGAISASVPYQVVIYGGSAAVINPTPVSIAFSAWNSSPTSLAANTVTKIAFQTVEFDIGGNFDNVTNYRFTAPLNKVYHFDAQVWLSDVNILTASMYNIVLYVNGAQFKLGNQGQVYNAAATVSSLSVDLQLLAGDYVEIYCENGNAATTVGTNSSQLATWFSGYAVGEGLAGSGVTPAQVQAQDFTSATDSGVADAYILDFSPALTGYINNFLFMFTPANSNATTTPTVQFNALTPVAIVKAGGAVAAGDIVAGKPAVALYSVANGSAELLNPQTVSGGGITPTSVAYFNALRFLPVVPPATNTTINLNTDTIYFQYMGYFPQSVTINYINMLVNTNTTGGTNVCQVGLVSGTSAPDGTNPGLALIGQVATNPAAPGQNTVAAGIVVPAGTFLWAAFSIQSKTGNIGSWGTSDAQEGFCLIASGDYLASGNTGWAPSFPSATNNLVMNCPPIVLRS